MDLYHSCMRAPCHPYVKLDGPLRTSLPPFLPIRLNGWTYTILARDRHVTPIRQMDGLIPFLHDSKTPPIRQNGRTNQNITTSMPPILQNGWAYVILVRDDNATHTPKWTDQLEHHCLHATAYAKMDGLIPFFHASIMPPIRQNARTNQNIITSMPPRKQKN
jgi:hypothetical protein